MKEQENQEVAISDDSNKDVYTKQISINNSSNFDLVDIILDSKKMDSIIRIATAMSKGLSTIPRHLQGNVADCTAIAMQAMQWGMNPFAVAQKTHLVNGTLGYEAQLVNAVVQSLGIIDGVFSYEWEGEGNSMKCRVGAKIKKTGEMLWNQFLNVSDVVVKNSPLWKTNPKQQMSYLQVKYWTRLYYPSAILGVYTDDELRECNIQTKTIKDISQTTKAYNDLIEKTKEDVVVIDDNKVSKDIIDDLNDKTIVDDGVIKKFKSLLVDIGIKNPTDYKEFMYYSEIDESKIDVLNDLTVNKPKLQELYDKFISSKGDDILDIE